MHRTDYISLPEAARYLAVDTKTLRRWLDEGRIEYLKIQAGISGRTHCRIRRDILEAFIESKTVRPQPKQVGRPQVVKIG